MKIISITSSGRKNGNTERVVRLMEADLAQMAAENNMKVEFEQINLSDSDLKFCRGCRICFDKGEDLCPLKDSLLIIRDKLIEADGLILASPVYVEDINGIMKNWIDRMAFNCHRPAFAGKTAVIVTTSAAGSSNHAIRTMKSALITWGFHISAQSKFRTGGLISDEQINARYSVKIKAIAAKLFNAVNGQMLKKPSFYSLMVFRVQQINWRKTEKEKNTYDYLYWNNKGWLDKDFSYYTSHGSNPVKVKLAGLVGSIVSIFFV